jgi:ubiquinone/menaquinone biosynthesis C-methylase UbiE
MGDALADHCVASFYLANGYHHPMKPSRTGSLIALVICAAVAAAIAQQRNPEDYAKTLEGAERVARMQVPRVVETLALKPGDRVADVGSGSGLFTRPIAGAVGPKGVAYAVDIDAGLLKIVERSAKEAGIENIRTVIAAADDPKLPEPVDLVLICDALHHIGNQGPYMKTLNKYVKPGGRVAVIDFSEQWPSGHESMRFTVQQLDAWMKDAGFSRAASYTWLENSFFNVYRKSGQRP